MSSHTRGPRRGHVPPHIQERLHVKRERAEARARRGPWYRRAAFVVPTAAIVAALVGLWVGRATAPDELAVPAAEAESLIFIADRGELIWTAGTPGGVPSVQAGIDALADGDTAVVTENLDTWLQSFEAIAQGYETTAIVGAAADGPRLLLLEAATVTREAVEALGAAATLEGEPRALMLDTVRRLRLRAQSLDRDGRLLLRERAADVSVIVPDVATQAPTLPRPTPPAPEPTEGSAASPTPAPSPTIEATPEASPTSP